MYCLSDSSPSLKRPAPELDSENGDAEGILRRPRSTAIQETQDQPLLKVLSFADDNDNGAADSKGDFTFYYFLANKKYPLFSILHKKQEC